MNIAFTICSNNYLAHAKTLGDSYLEHHPDHIFVIGLVDKFNEEVDYSIFNKFEIVLVEILSINNFKDLNSKYNITELNTAVKPAYIDYLFQKFKADVVLYIDPDILIVSPLTEVFEVLDSQNIVITPHMCSPVDDSFGPTDYNVLGGGVYNLGFIGLSNYLVVRDFISWWNDRVVKYGFRNYSKGMFYDQLWINYVPCFYDNYFILKHLGYNMANWNLHERQLTLNDENKIVVNDIFPLRFFHFSSYKYTNKNEICWYQNRYDFNSRPDLKDIFYNYYDLLLKNNIQKLSKVTVYYYPELNQATIKSNLSKSNEFVLKKVIKRVKKAIRVLIKG